MGSESEPAKLLLPYLQRADELQKHEPLVAYYCRLYGMERGLKIPPKDRTKTTNALLVSLMNQLEKDKKSLKLGNDDSLYLEGFASNVFSKADKQDRAGRADVNTAKTFYAASLFFEIINQFGELQPDLEQKQKYAVWKAADIRKALKEGRKPEPGPPGGEKDISSSPVTSYDAGNNENLGRSESFAGSQPGLDTSSRPADDTYTHQNSSYAPSSPPSYPTSDYPAHDFSSHQAPPAPSPPSLPSSPPPSLPTNRPENTVYHQTYQHAQAYPSDQNYPSNHTDPTSYNYANFQFYPSFHESSLPATSGNYPSHQGFDGPYSHPQPGPELSNYTVAPTYNNGSKGEIDSRKTSQSTFSFSYNVNYKPAPEKISEAHKAAKFAVGALAFDDVPVAVDFLKQALELLTKSSVGQ